MEITIPGTPGGVFQCGGSFRDASHVVTAAHCVTDEEGSPYPTILPPSATEVGYASARWFDQLGAEPMTLRSVTRVSVHPAYKRNRSSERADVAVLTLSSAADFSSPAAEDIPFAALAEYQDAIDDQVDALPDGLGIVSGWGAIGDGENAPTSDDLLAPDVLLRTDSPCTDVYGQDYDAATMLCAGGDGIADTCQGDSGGPLAIDDPEQKSNERLLAGITSFGDGCAVPGIPGVYACVHSPELEPWLRIENPAAAPSATPRPPNPTVTGTFRVGANVACNAAPLAGAAPAQYLWYHVTAAGFAQLATDAQTLTLPLQAATRESSATSATRMPAASSTRTRPRPRRPGRSPASRSSRATRPRRRPRSAGSAVSRDAAGSGSGRRTPAVASSARSAPS